MAYNKNTWKNGDKITPELLNNIESGIEEAHKLFEKLEKLLKKKIEPKTKKVEQRSGGAIPLSN